jgi:hypothetical protein
MRKLDQLRFSLCPRFAFTPKEGILTNFDAIRFGVLPAKGSPTSGLLKSEKKYFLFIFVEARKVMLYIIFVN